MKKRSVCTVGLSFALTSCAFVTTAYAQEGDALSSAKADANAQEASSQTTPTEAANTQEGASAPEAGAAPVADAISTSAPSDTSTELNDTTSNTNAEVPAATEELDAAVTHAYTLASASSPSGEADPATTPATTSTDTDSTLEASAPTPETRVYLSDMTPDVAQIGYNTLHKDTNINGGPISLLVDGQATSFPKGIMAHATSALVYRIDDIVASNPYFSAYFGVDASQKNNGDGVQFYVFGSADGKQWKSVFTSQKLRANLNAEYKAFDMSAYSYMRIYIDSLGNNYYDHSELGMAMFSNILASEANPLPTIESLSSQIEELEAKGVTPKAPVLSDIRADSPNPEENDTSDEATLTRLIWQKKLLTTIGRGSLGILYKMSDTNARAIDYLWNHDVALENFMAWDDVDAEGSYYSALQAFISIYTEYPNVLVRPDEHHFYLRLALAVAHAYGRPSMDQAWEKPNVYSDPVTRFKIYAKLVESKIFDYAGDAFAPARDETLPSLGSGPLSDPTFILPDTLDRNLAVGQKTASGDTKLAPTTGQWRWSTRDFVDLSLPLMRWVVDTRMNNDEIAWLKDYTWTTQSGNKNKLFNAYTYITYTMGYNYNKDKYYDENNKATFDGKYHFSSYFSDYSEHIIRLWRIFSEGSVCGGLAKTYANLAEIYGRPSAVTAQPGHAAALTYVWNNRLGRYVWTIQNNIFGWAKSNNEFNYKLLNWGRDQVTTWTNASYTAMATDALQNGSAYTLAATYIAQAEASTNDGARESYLLKALDLIPYHETAWKDLIALYAKSNKTQDEWLILARTISENFTYYPLPMVDMLKRIEPYITDANAQASVQILKHNSLLKARAVTNAQGYNPILRATLLPIFWARRQSPLPLSPLMENMRKLSCWPAALPQVACACAIA